MALVALPGSSPAAGLQEAAFTQVVNQVSILEADSRTSRPASLRDVLHAPDLVRTGPRSRAELTAPDQTITRVGSNAIFSFEPNGRSLRLQQGSVLFHSPQGRGGGTIRTGGATAAVLGTTLLVSATVDGGFKVILLEGKGRVSLANGLERVLEAGQLVFVLGDRPQFSPVFNVQLDRLVEGSALIQGFEGELPSVEKIQREVRGQQRKIRRGRLEKTEVRIDGQKVDREHGAESLSANRVERIFGDEFTSGLESALRSRIRFTGAPFPRDNLFFEEVDVQVPALPFDDYRGLIAGQLELAATLINLTSLDAQGLPYFDFMGLETLKIEQSFVASSGVDLPLFLTGIGSLEVASGLVLRYDNPGGLHLLTARSLELDQVTLRSLGGRVWVQNGQGSLQLKDVQSFSDDLNLYAGEGLDIEDTVFNAVDTIEIGPASNQLQPKAEDGSTVGGTLTFLFPSGNMDIRQTTFNAPDLAVRAANELTLNTVTLSAAARISLAARTLNLRNVAFPGGSTVTLASQLGVLAANPNTGQASIPGHVNFINGVTYGGAPAQNAVGTGIDITTLSNP